MSIESIDLVLFQRIHSDMKNEIFDWILPYVRNKMTWFPLYAYLVYHLYQKFNKRMILICIGVLCTIALSDILCAQVLKNVFQRIRPCHLFLTEKWFNDFGLCSSTYSFPSCHASNHMAFSSFIWYFFRRRLRFLFFVWVVLIGFSQIYIGVHYPSDVLGGMIIGLILGTLTFRLYNLILIRMNIKQV